MQTLLNQSESPTIKTTFPISIIILVSEIIAFAAAVCYHFEKIKYPQRTVKFSMIALFLFMTTSLILSSVCVSSQIDANGIL